MFHVSISTVEPSKCPKGFVRFCIPNPHVVLGAEITVTRKGQDNYCFVKFASIEEAKNFMAKHNHQPLRECSPARLDYSQQ